MNRLSPVMCSDANSGRDSSAIYAAHRRARAWVELLARRAARGELAARSKAFMSL